MGKPEYEPVTDLSNLITMLQNLFVYWVNWPRLRLLIAGADLIHQSPTIEGGSVMKIAETLHGIETMEAFLDLSLAKILHRLGLEVADIHRWGRREKRRTLKGTKAKQEIKAINAKPVLETFYSLQFPEKAKLHKVAEMIYDDLERRFGKGESPSISTIIRVLKADTDIWKQFDEIKGEKRNSYVLANVTSA